MQTLLLYTIEVIVFTTTTYAVIGFILGLLDRWQRLTHTINTLAVAADLAELTEQVEEAIAPSADLSDLLSIAAAPQPVRWSDCYLKQLRALGSLEQVRNSARWTKPQAIAHFQTI